MINYIIEINLMIVVIYLLYRVFLAEESSFQFNRMFLLFGLLFAAIIPLVELPLLPNDIEMPAYFSTTGTIDKIQPITSYENVPENDSTISWGDVFNIVYLLGFMVILLRLSVQIFQILKASAFARKENNQSYKIVRHPKAESPSSFFNILFWSKPASQFTEEDQLILEHEMVHMRQKHSFDLVLAEVLRCICWFNPVITWYKKAIETNHEYLVDAELSEKSDAETYQKLLLVQTAKNLNLDIINYFNYSTIQKRIAMMKRTKKKTSNWKFVAIATVLLGTAGLFACEEQEIVAQLPKLEEAMIDINELETINVVKPSEGEKIIQFKFKDKDNFKREFEMVLDESVKSSGKTGILSKKNGNWKVELATGEVVSYRGVENEEEEKLVQGMISAAIAKAEKGERLMGSKNKEGERPVNFSVSDGEDTRLDVSISEGGEKLEATDLNDEVFEIVEIMPQAKKGEATVKRALTEAISKTNLLPKGTKVYFQFIIDKEGKPGSFNVVSGWESLSTENKGRLMRHLNDTMFDYEWEAGSQRGHKVSTRMIMPLEVI